MNEERANAMIQEIGGEIIRDPGVAEHDWDSLAVVAWEEGPLSNCFGYRYLGDEIAAIEFETEGLLDLFMELRGAMAEGEPRPWLTCLYTIKKPNFEIEVDYDYDNRDRWKVNARNFDTMPARLRPS